MTRTKARERAFALVFEMEISGQGAEEILACAAEDGEEVTDGYTLRVFRGVCARLDELDGIIRENLRGWRLERLSKVVLALLRLAVYEIRYEADVPPEVSVNEAVQLCKNYATDEDAAYLNGVLGAVVRGAAE